MVQKWPYFQLFFLGNIGQENVFYDILEQKNGSLACKNKKFKKSQNWHFSKGVNPWFWSWAFFQLFFVDSIGQENVFYEILERKNAILAYKNKMFNSWKLDIFPKGLTHEFGPKMAIFTTFFFREYKPGKCLLRCSKTKIRLSRL